MNDLGKRLDDLAGRATAGATLLDPSRGEFTAGRPLRLRSLVIGVAALVAVVASLAVWQGRDGSTTSVVAGQGDGQETSVPLFSDPCDLDAILPVLRAEVPTFDYEPAGSYAALAERSAVVVTGKVVSAVRAEVNGISYIELTPVDVVELQDGFWSAGEVDVIAYQAVWANRSQTDPLASPAAFEDLTFVAFLSPYSGVRGGWAPGPEGLYVGCADQPMQAVFNDAAGPDDPAGWNADVLSQFLIRSAIEDEVPAQEQAGATDDTAADETAGDSTEQALAEAAQDEAQRDGAGQAEPSQAEQDAAEAARVAADAARIAAENARRVEEERIAALGIDPPTTIAEARALWEAAAISEYRLRYVHWQADGPTVAMTVSVVHGEVATAVYDELGGDERASTDGDPVWTVDDLFDLAESVDNVREITFDRTTGFPTVMSLDPDFDLPGDELSVRNITLDSRAELDAIDARIAAWLPPASDPPEAVQAFVGRQASDVSQVYLLHEQRDLDAFAYLANDDICVVVLDKVDVEGAAEYSDEASGSCVPTTGFDSRPIVLTNTRRPIGPDYVIPDYTIVVQSLDAYDAGWTAEADAGRLDVTTRSALLIVDDSVTSPSGRVLLEISCPCGDETYILPNR